MKSPSIMDHVELALTSGLSIAEYARRNGIDVERIYRAKSSRGRNVERPTLKVVAEPAKFLKVVKAPAPVLNSESAFEIILKQVGMGLWDVSIRSMPTGKMVDLISMADQAKVYQL